MSNYEDRANSLSAAEQLENFRDLERRFANEQADNNSLFNALQVANDEIYELRAALLDKSFDRNERLSEEESTEAVVEIASLTQLVLEALNVRNNQLSKSYAKAAAEARRLRAERDTRSHQELRGGF